MVASDESFVSFLYINELYINEKKDVFLQIGRSVFFCKYVLEMLWVLRKTGQKLFLSSA